MININSVLFIITLISKCHLLHKQQKRNVVYLENVFRMIIIIYLRILMSLNMM